MTFKIKVCEPSIGDAEIQHVVEALRQNHLSSASPPVRRFESAFATRLGIEHAVATNSGGSALFLVLKALGIGPRDEVILPTLAMIACSAAVVHCGASPVFVDSQAHSPNIDAAKIEQCITSRTRVIMAVHLYGQPCDMGSIRAVAERHRLAVVEDAAEALGGTWNGQPLGTLGTAGCFSFYANKIMTTGDGGMIVTRDGALADRLRRIRAYDFDDRRHFIHGRDPWNMKLSGLEAALGLAQLTQLDTLIQCRRRVFRYYQDQLRMTATAAFVSGALFDGSVPWLFGLLVPKRDELEYELAVQGVETRRFFVPLHRQSLHTQEGYFPNAERYSATGILLPSASHMTQAEQDYVIDAVRSFYAR
jgi:perosamine synthetase